MKAAIVGEVLVVVLPLNNPIEESASGKSMVVASSHGNQRTAVKIENGNLIVNANAYVRRKKVKSKRRSSRKKNS
jgi:hypothetical protein